MTDSVTLNEHQLMNQLQTVMDPEIHLSIVDLGLIYGVDIDQQRQMVTVKMTLTSPGCPYGPKLIADVKDRMYNTEGVKSVEVEIVWTPPWNPAEMASDEVKDRLGIW